MYGSAIPRVMAQGDELAPWALALTGNQSLRLCRGELHAEDSVAPIGWGGPLASGVGDVNSKAAASICRP